MACRHAITTPPRRASSIPMAPFGCCASALAAQAATSTRTCKAIRIRMGNLVRSALSSLILLNGNPSGDDGGRRHVAGDVEHPLEQVGDRVRRDEEAERFHGDAKSGD